MSTTILPSLPAVGGCVTQQLLTTLTSNDKRQHSKFQSINHGKFKGKLQGSLLGTLKERDIIDVARYDY